MRILPLFIEPTHELLGVEVKEFSRELGTRKRGVGPASWCEIVVWAVRRPRRPRSRAPRGFSAEPLCSVQTRSVSRVSA